MPTMKMMSLILVLITLFFSCVSRKQLCYIQSEAESLKIDTFNVNNLEEYKLQPGDILNVEISSISPSAIEIFASKYKDASNIQISEASIYMNGYHVSNAGELELPLLGKIFVNGLSVDSITVIIEKQLNAHLDYYTVSVKLANFRVSILGEVRNPGTYVIYSSRFNVLQAISLAGDITDYGDREKVKLVRKRENATSVVTLDLSDRVILASEYFYLHPNDIIYIEPLNAKVFKINSNIIQLTVSIITLFVLVYGVIIKN